MGGRSSNTAGTDAACAAPGQIPAVVRLVVMGSQLTLNRLLRTHWAMRRRRQRRIEWELAAQLAGQRGKLQLPFAAARIVVTRYGCGVEPDHDNLVAGGKLILDALRKCNVIADDSPGCVGAPAFFWVRARSADTQRTTIDVYRVAR